MTTCNQGSLAGRPSCQLHAAALIALLLICGLHHTEARPDRGLLDSEQGRKGDTPASAPEDQSPGIELVARQALFNYATTQGLDILKTKIKDISVPDISKSFNLPLVGDFKLQLSSIKVSNLTASSDEAKFEIMMEHFALWVTQVEAQISFTWHWEKLGMQGTGSGELNLHGGEIEYKFRVDTDSDTGNPQIMVDQVDSRFSSVELTIHSFSADWLYQAILSLFNDQIQKAVQNGIANALQNDVPNSLNNILGTLPTHLAIQGLPFTTVFDYSIFTLTYVMVKGYGQVESDVTTPSLFHANLATPATSAVSSATSAVSSATSALTATSASPVSSQGNPDIRSRQLLSAFSGLQNLVPSLLTQLKRRTKGGGEGKGSSKNAEGEEGEVGQMLQMEGLERGKEKKREGQVRKGVREGAKTMAKCPFAATALPIGGADIAADGHMTSIYLHESVLNCMLWGLAKGNALTYSIQDGTIPRLHLTTDLLAMLIPQLPKTYPHQMLRIDASAVGTPSINFKTGAGTEVQGSYRTVISVANETLGNPVIATLSANLTITGQLNWDSTIITSVQVKHKVEESAMTIDPVRWDSTVAWFIQNYAGLYPMSFLVNTFVSTPVTSRVALVNAQATTYDGWYALSGDVQVQS